MLFFFDLMRAFVWILRRRSVDSVFLLFACTMFDLTFDVLIVRGSLEVAVCIAFSISSPLSPSVALLALLSSILAVLRACAKRAMVALACACALAECDKSARMRFSSVCAEGGQGGKREEREREKEGSDGGPQKGRERERERERETHLGSTERSCEGRVKVNGVPRLTPEREGFA